MTSCLFLVGLLARVKRLLHIKLAIMLTPNATRQRTGRDARNQIGKTLLYAADGIPHGRVGGFGDDRDETASTVSEAEESIAEILQEVVIQGDTREAQRFS